MERTLDAIAADLGLDRTVVRERNFIQPDEMPYDQGLIFQDGRPLVYDSGDFPASLAKLKKLVDWDGFEAYRAQAHADGRTVGLEAVPVNQLLQLGQRRGEVSGVVDQ